MTANSPLPERDSSLDMVLDFSRVRLHDRQIAFLTKRVNLASSASTIVGIDAWTDLHIVQVESNVAGVDTICTVLERLEELEKLDRDALVELWTERGGNLEAEFSAAFGHPLPDTVNSVQFLTVFAAAADARFMLLAGERGCDSAPLELHTFARSGGTVSTTDSWAWHQMRQQDRQIRIIGESPLEQLRSFLNVYLLNCPDVVLVERLYDAYCASFLPRAAYPYTGPMNALSFWGFIEQAFAEKPVWERVFITPNESRNATESDHYQMPPSAATSPLQRTIAYRRRLI